MKATLEIPDEMYREVKAKSALRGQTVRAVTIMLYDGWLRGGFGDPVAVHLGDISGDTRGSGRATTLACFGIGRRFVRKNADGPHDMDSIRKSIAEGRTA